MDLFRDISRGKHFTKRELKKEAKHELDELGGMEKAEKYEKHKDKIWKEWGKKKEMYKKTGKTVALEKVKKMK